LPKICPWETSFKLRALEDDPSHPDGESALFASNCDQHCKNMTTNGEFEREEENERARNVGDNDLAIRWCNALRTDLVAVLIEEETCFFFQGAACWGICVLERWAGQNKMQSIGWADFQALTRQTPVLMRAENRKKLISPLLLGWLHFVWTLVLLIWIQIGMWSEGFIRRLKLSKEIVTDTVLCLWKNVLLDISTFHCLFLCSLCRMHVLLQNSADCLQLVWIP
jgi:hypothetical protein